MSLMGRYAKECQKTKQNTKGEIRPLDLTGMSRALSPAELPWHNYRIIDCFYLLIKIFIFKYFYFIILKKGEFMDSKSLPKCPIETTLLMLSSRWKFLIVKELLKGSCRFNDLKNNVGKISQKVLTYNLREMEENELITRKVFNSMPPKVEYTLTD